MDNPANDHGGPATSAIDPVRKRAIRTQARADRARFGTHPIGSPAQYLALLSRDLVVTAYAPIGDEADPATLIRAALGAGCRIALPHVVDRSIPMRFLEWNDAEQLDAGPLGLRQPLETANEVEPDVILTPLVAFDAALNRLGQGAGYYDRAFVRYPDAKRIGVAYSVQQVAAIVPDPWDVALDAVITEQGWLTR